MYKILRYIRQNTTKVVIIALAVIFGYVLLRTANSAYKNQEKEAGKNIKEQIVTIEANEDVIVTNKSSQNLIKSFLDKCTNGKYEEAYNFLSENCKENLYQTVESFEMDYCRKYAIKGKGYSIEKYSDISDYTYRIAFNNMLSTGKTELNMTYDYYTITVDNGKELKLNINSYLKSTNIEHEKKIGQVCINIKRTNTFIYYETVVVEIINNSKEEVFFGTGVYGLDENNKKIKTKDTKTVLLKEGENKTIVYEFDKSINTKMQNVAFENVKFNYNTDNQYNEEISISL